VDDEWSGWGTYYDIKLIGGESIINHLFGEEGDDSNNIRVFLKIDFSVPIIEV
jgi:hypothetical protein